MHIKKNKSQFFMYGPWITDYEIEVVNDAMKNGWYEKAYWYVETFQKEFAEWHGRKFGIMTPNCTTAIHLLLTALGIEEGDEIIVPECTWIATAAPITYLKATPVFCDIDPVHWCLDPDSVKNSITNKTKAIIVVDLFGNMPLMDEIIQIASEHNLYLIEDAAEALGSTYKGRKAGSFGTGSVYSFHRTKTITTGEGGMLILDNEELFDRAMFLRDHGRKPDGPMYYNYEVTYKYMPFNLQAALGYAQFKRIDELLAKKRWIFDTFKKHLADLDDIELNVEPVEGYNSIWSGAVVFGKSYNIGKVEFIYEMEKLGYPARPFFYPLSSLPAYPGFRESYESKNKRAYDISARGINLPASFILTDNQIKEYSDSLSKILLSRKKQKIIV